MYYKRMLLAIDGSENSRRAAYETSKLMGGDADVTVLHVLDPDDAQKDVVRSSTEREWNKQKKDTLSAVIRYFDEAKIDHKYLARRGLPSREIIKEANSGNYEVLIIGSRGLNIFQEMVLGSVSHRVAKYAKIPVVIVK